MPMFVEACMSVCVKFVTFYTCAIINFLRFLICSVAIISI